MHCDPSIAKLPDMSSLLYFKIHSHLSFNFLQEALDSMVNNEFWYSEGSSRAEGRCKGERPSKRWWLPSPQVPRSGLSDSGRRKLMHQGRVIHQVLKAAKSINESVLLEMPVPIIIRDALPKVSWTINVQLLFCCRKNVPTLQFSF